MVKLALALWRLGGMEGMTTSESVGNPLAQACCGINRGERVHKKDLVFPLNGRCAPGLWKTRGLPMLRERKSSVEAVKFRRRGEGFLPDYDGDVTGIPGEGSSAKSSRREGGRRSRWSTERAVKT